MKKLIACLLATILLLSGVVLAIGAVDGELPRPSVDHGPLTSDDVDSGLIAEWYPVTSRPTQIGENVYCTIYCYALSVNGDLYYEASITGTGAINDYSASRIMLGTNNRRVDRVYIEDGVTRIGDYAFNGASILSYVQLPDSLESIGDHAFYGTALTDVNMPDGITTIEEYAFAYAPSLTSVTLPADLVTIGDYAFYRSPELTTVTAGDKIESIGERAFAYTTNLTTFEIPDSVTEMGDYIFLSSGIRELRVPASMSYVPEKTFSGNRSMTSIELHDGITEIRDTAFFMCTSLESIGIPRLCYFYR